MGTPHKHSFTNRVRTAIKDLVANGEACTTDAISVQALVTTRAEHKRMINALYEMVKAGELIRVDTGLYAPADQKKPQELRSVMWWLLRNRRVVSVDDLMEMAFVTQSYAAEWLRTLVKHGVVRQDGNRFRLLKDTIDMPELTDNADKLRALRDKKKQAALLALEVANRAIDQARTALNDL